MEITALRHQLFVLQRTNRKRLRFCASDRILGISRYRFWLSEIQIKSLTGTVRLKMVGNHYLARLRVGIVYADSKGHDLGAEIGKIDQNLSEGDQGRKHV